MSNLNFINHIFHGFNDLVSDVSHFFYHEGMQSSSTRNTVVWKMTTIIFNKCFFLKKKKKTKSGGHQNISRGTYIFVTCLSLLRGFSIYFIYFCSECSDSCICLFGLRPLPQRSLSTFRLLIGVKFGLFIGLAPHHTALLSTYHYQTHLLCQVLTGICSRGVEGNLTHADLQA